MNYWIVTDTHFNHSKLEEWGGRSGDWQEQIEKGLESIPSGDVLIHLGDICIGNDTEVHKRILGVKELDGNCYGGAIATDVKRILVRGNHDKAGLNKYYAWGWDFVVDGFELIYNGHYLHFTHRPARPQGNTSWNIHGHTHGNMHRSEEYLEFYDKAYHIDLSPELVGYKPIRLDTLLNKKNHTHEVLD